MREKNDLKEKLAEDHSAFLKRVFINKERRDEHKIMNDDQFNCVIESIKKYNEQAKELKNSVKD
ncbi:hypothetical protein GS16_02060 [Candidatus Liberibacter solanacearum]|uniref:Uncharacterized protein n=1 Tax=Candidatus Liberibacter solanacearum TaxID=556287 RepID=A0A094Z468_9HYPH|nr:hypothetical protein GS16_02060 [Candidatus Liberibacter solanacearum]KJZ81485.1 hypothetical protein KP07_01025 [Candidatus Liberibacter solanacearum]KJZ82629.1 hypothetical protein DJ66_0238 [Candidatus Liberibacter solanacearum]KQC49122.1 hypothetical protein AP064_03450 [Candidatus Liberibacter solanacearum]